MDCWGCVQIKIVNDSAIWFIVVTDIISKPKQCLFLNANTCMQMLVLHETMACFAHGNWFFIQYMPKLCFTKMLENVMASFKIAPSHYLKRYQFIFKGLLWNSPESYFTGYVNALNPQHVFGDYPFIGPQDIQVPWWKKDMMVLANQFWNYHWRRKMVFKQQTLPKIN